jgi:hypothetical protein
MHRVSFHRQIFNFKKRCQLLIRAHDGAFAIAAVSINDKDSALLASDERDASPAPA